MVAIVKKHVIVNMNPLKKFVYYSLQIIIGVPVLGFAVLTAKHYGDHLQVYYNLNEWFTEHFLNE